MVKKRLDRNREGVKNSEYIFHVVLTLGSMLNKVLYIKKLKIKSTRMEKTKTQYKQNQMKPNTFQMNYITTLKERKEILILVTLEQSI